MTREASAGLAALVRAATRRFTEDQAAIVQQALHLQRIWLEGGPPPLGTPVSRWWDARLAELRAALTPPQDAVSQAGDSLPTVQDRWVLRLLSVLSDLDRCEHGRHEGDPCESCGGSSAGNPHVGPDRVIGYGRYGTPLVLPTRGSKTDPAAWRQTKENNS
ncbi:hypothetical protein ABZZ79_03370 [Streptomyces sp. NPDC006458]|uniref:hypothetical protein n=1 Tax=Streptomyces sp. NPDC006458 TaxID=3154302 RepID=UPI00339DAE13